MAVCCKFVNQCKNIGHVFQFIDARQLIYITVILNDYCQQVMMVKKMQETDTENEIREAYRVFDKERTGRIAVSEMRHILSNLPEKLSHEEIDEMLRTADKVFILIKTFLILCIFKKGLYARLMVLLLLYFRGKRN